MTFTDDCIKMVWIYILKKLEALMILRGYKPWLKRTWKRKSKLFTTTMVVSSLQRPSITIARL
jgi:hypothetical protein